MDRDFVVPAVVWSNSAFISLGARSKLAYIFLFGKADIAGIGKYVEGEMEKALMLSISVGEEPGSTNAERKVVGILARKNLVRRYTVAGEHYFWIPWFSTMVPTSGKMAPPVLKYPAPDIDMVHAYMVNWSNGPKYKKDQLKKASPRTFGKFSIHSKAAHLREICQLWRKYQKRPAAGRYSSNAATPIVAALKSYSESQVKNLIMFVFESSHSWAAFMRGENKTATSYTGLRSILRDGKMADRVQLAEQWAAKRRPEVGYGPLEKFRKGPEGTSSDFKERPERLNNQSGVMLRLLIERGDAGVWTSELAEIALKYSARVSELRGKGYDIALVERKEDGNNRYVLYNYGGGG